MNAVALALLSFTCAFPAMRIIPFTHMLQDQGAGSDGSQGPHFTWIKSEAEWKSLGFADKIEAQRRNPSRKDLAKDLDFTRHDVLIFTLGDVGSTGASITLEKIETNGKTIFHLAGKQPEPGKAHGMMITHPMHMVRVDKGLPSSKLELLLNGKPAEYAFHIGK